MTGDLRIARVYDHKRADDGMRLLCVQKRWPPVSDRLYTEWVPALAPSATLRASVKKFQDRSSRYFMSPDERWTWYVSRFTDEMRQRLESRNAIRRVQGMLAIGENVTILCFCKDEARCHRRLLRDIILREETLS